MNRRDFLRRLAFAGAALAIGLKTEKAKPIVPARDFQLDGSQWHSGISYSCAEIEAALQANNWDSMPIGIALGDATPGELVEIKMF